MRRRPTTGHPGQGWKGRIAIAIRLATLIRMAQACRWLPPLRQLARELGVCERTVKRDLEALEAARVILPLEGESRAISLVAQFGGGR
jgi:predicted DNA-binding transcriptional regulator YafY